MAAFQRGTSVSQWGWAFKVPRCAIPVTRIEAKRNLFFTPSQSSRTVISETEEVGSMGTHSVYDLNLAEACLMWASVMSGIFSLSVQTGTME